MTQLENMRRLLQQMNEGTPHGNALGFQIVSVEPGEVVLRTPYRPELVGDPDTGVLAGGVVTALLDHVSGQAVMAAMDTYSSIATLDLRIDYMRGAEPGRDLFAHAHCYKLTRSVAFVRATAYETEPSNPVATSQAAFMLDANAGRKAGANLKPSRREPRA